MKTYIGLAVLLLVFVGAMAAFAQALAPLPDLPPLASDGSPLARESTRPAVVLEAPAGGGAAIVLDNWQYTGVSVSRYR